MPSVRLHQEVIVKAPARQKLFTDRCQTVSTLSLKAECFDNLPGRQVNNWINATQLFSGVNEALQITTENKNIFVFAVALVTLFLGGRTADLSTCLWNVDNDSCLQSFRTREASKQVCQHAMFLVR